MKHLLAALLTLTIFISCSKDKDEVKDYTAENEQEITDYLAKNNLTAQRTASGLYYIINEPLGEGDNPTPSSNVTVKYKGYFTNGNVFDKDEEGVSYGLGQLISGWKEGIPYLKPGGSGKFLIPAHLGYGSKGNNTIPGGAVLIFDITLVSVN